MTSVSMPVPFDPVEFTPRSSASTSTSTSASTSASTSRRPTEKPTKATKATKTTKTTKANPPKDAKGPNSDHRKEQNRIASKNYREKRKQKLALLQQILDEPAEGGNTDTAVTAANANAQSAEPGSSLPTGIVPSYNMATFPDALPVVFPGFSDDFQPDMLTDLLSSGTANLAVPPTQPTQTASPSDPLTSTTSTTTTAGTSPPWTAAESASHPSNPFSWMFPEPPLNAATATTTSAAATLSTAELGAFDMPFHNSWTVPFTSDVSPPSPPAAAASSSATPPTSLPSLSSATTASSSAPSDTIDTLDPLGNAFNLDPTLDLDQMMRSDLAPASFSTGMPMADTAFSAFSKSTPAAQATLPSRPSPRAVWTSLAQPSGPSNTYPTVPPATSATSATSTHTAASMSPAHSSGPSRRTRKKNKPVVRAMLQYVQTLSSHQKRLILKALLDEGEGAGSGSGMPGQGADAAERVEEVDQVNELDDEDMDEDDNDDSGPSSHYVYSTMPPSTDARATIIQTLHRERRRKVASRWNAPSKEKALASATAAYTNISISSLGEEYQAFSAGFSSTSPTGRAQLPPTFMTMTLQCRRLTFCVAILNNWEACGLPNPTAMLDESCVFENVDCSSTDDLQSPFALAADEARAVVTQGPARIAAAVAAVRKKIEQNGKTPPKDLQPVDAQILVAHHPYIDTIPFHGFRARALALLAQMEADECIAEAAQQSANMLYSSAAGSAAPELDAQGLAAGTPCLLDEDELCYDMHVADGLICWGSQIGNDGMGLSPQAMRDSASSRDMRAGVPWDMRSWEPQVWFLKKYWYLVGGWDDDMWRNCRWWHSMRGEDLDYSVFTAPGY